MKKLFSLLLITVLLISTTGCDFSFLDKITVLDSAEITEADSVSQFNIYPENSKFQIVGKFERSGYNQLNQTQKGLYILMDNAVFNMQSGYISLGNATEKDITIAFLALRNDRPEYFWLPTSYALKTKGTLGEICFAKTEKDWLYTATERKAFENKIFDVLTKINQKFSGNETEFTREILAHDTLVDRAEYDFENVNNFKNNPSSWNIVGAFLNGKAVCEGYAKSMQVLGFLLGLDCATVTGVSTEPHMWNVINIENNWYHLDPTANDTNNEGYHFFFNVTTEYILKSCTIDSSVDSLTDIDAIARGNIFLPTCTATEYNYHVVNSLYIAEKSQIESTVVSMICAARRSGQKMVEFAVSPEMNFVFGTDDTLKTFKIERYISIANSELGSKRIKKYSYGGVKGALGFMISW